MIIKTLHLENFQNITNADINFESGITVFNGPNASGKSGVLAAIGFCLSEMKRSESWEDYVQSGKKYMLIKMEVMFDKLATFIYRGDIKSETVSSMSKHIHYGDEDYYNSECKPFLDKMLDADMISNIIFTMQDSPSITKLRPLDRRDIFKKIFNSDFSDASEAIRLDIENTKALQSTLQTEIDTLSSKSYNLNRLEIQDPDLLSKLLKEKEEILEENEHIQQQAILYQEYQSRKQNRAALARRINFDQEALKKMKPPEEIEKELISTTVAITEADKRAVEIEHEIAVCLKTEKELDQEADSLDDDILDIKKRHEDLITIGQALAVDVIQAKRHLDIHRQGICNECGQTCDSNKLPELENALKVATQKKENIDATLEAEATRLKEFHSKRDEVNHRRADVERSRDKLREELKYIREKIETLRCTKNKLSLEKDNCFSMVESFKASITKTTAELASEDEWLASHSFEEILSLRSTDDVDRKIASYYRVEATNEEKKKQNEALVKEKEKDELAIKQKAEKKNEQAQLEADLSAAKAIYEVALPNYVNSKACILCEQYMNSFLSMTKDSFLVKLIPTKKGISFLYQPRPSCGFINAKQASGFESAILTLAFKAAIAYAYHSDLFVLDEPDKDADSDSSVRFFETLLSINSGFKQMIVITHRSNAVNYLKDNGAVVYEVEDGTFTRRI